MDDRTGVAQPFVQDISRALDGIAERLRQIARVEQARKTEIILAKRAVVDLSDGGLSGSDTKRFKPDPEVDAAGDANAARVALAGFNWLSIGRDIVTGLIIANLQHFSEEAIHDAISVSSTILASIFYILIPI